MLEDSLVVGLRFGDRRRQELVDRGDALHALENQRRRDALFVFFESQVEVEHAAPRVGRHEARASSSAAASLGLQSDRRPVHRNCQGPLEAVLGDPLLGRLVSVLSGFKLLHRRCERRRRIIPELFEVAEEVTHRSPVGECVGIRVCGVQVFAVWICSLELPGAVCQLEPVAGLDPLKLQGFDFPAL